MVELLRSVNYNSIILSRQKKKKQNIGSPSLEKKKKERKVYQGNIYNGRNIEDKDTDHRPPTLFMNSET